MTLATDRLPQAVPTAQGPVFSNRRVLVRGMVLPLALLALWAAVAHSGLVNTRIIVPVERVLAVPFTDVHGRHLWMGMVVSLLRMLAGFGIGAAAGLGLGVLMGLSHTAERLFGPSFHAVRQIALYAWIPLLTAWFGNGDTAKIVFIALSAFFPMVLNTHEGLRSISPQHREVARVLRLSRARLIRRVLLPGAMPSIAIGVQLALIYAWISTVGAEYAMGLGVGLGTLLSEGREHFRMDIVIVGVLALALVGFLLHALFNRLFARLLRWRGPAT